MIWVYVRLYLMFFLRVMLLIIGVEIAYFIICGIRTLLHMISFSSRPIVFPDLEYVELISFGVAVLLSLQTTYIIGGKRGKVWSNEFGFDKDKFKIDGEDK